MDTVHEYAVDGQAFVNGKEVDINMILPTSSHVTEARSDLDDNAQTMFTHTVRLYCLGIRVQEILPGRSRPPQRQNGVERGGGGGQAGAS